MNIFENLSEKNKEKIQLFRNNFSFAMALILSLTAFIFFLFRTEFIYNELLIAILSFVFIYPFRNSAKIIKSYFGCLITVFVAWLFFGLGSTIFPFIFAIIIGYLLNPLVTKLEKIGLPRWSSALITIIVATGIIVVISIFFFPILVEQANTITKQISQYITDLKEFGTSNKTFDFFERFGIEKDTVKQHFESVFLPKIESVASTLFATLLKLFLSISDLATQVINIIILPILTFYFLKDFSKFKDKLNTLLAVENANIIKYIDRFDTVMRTYIGWQITASCIVATVGSIVFSIFSVPYGILIACIAGLLNPIPFFGAIFGILIGGLVALLVNDGYFISYFIIIFSTIGAVNFINAYLLEPTIAGNKVGLHPVIMILSIFIFNSLFGILGMLVAVPITAIIVTLLRDAYGFYIANKNSVLIASEQKINQEKVNKEEKNNQEGEV